MAATASRDLLSPMPVALPVMGHRDGHRAPATPDHQAFDTLADRYDRLHDLQADPIGTWLPGVLPQRGRRALDAGCGSGRHTLALADASTR